MGCTLLLSVEVVVDVAPSDAPQATDLEAWNLTAGEHALNGDLLQPQERCHFGHGQEFVIGLHRTH